MRAEVDIQRIADAAANRAAHETIVGTFKLFGVDLNSTQSVNEFRTDLISIRRFRRFLKWVVTIVGGAALLGLSNWLTKHFH